jgi:hypothetical protein
MKYAIILTENPDGRIHVAIPALAYASIEAEDREAAIALARETIARVASQSEVLYLEMPESFKSVDLDHDVPWDLFGAAKDDRTWDALFDQIEQQRDMTRKAS